MNNAVGTAC